jgi:uncharacterized membrane protein
MSDIAEHRDSRAAGVVGAIYLLLFPIPVLCFVGALVTDIAYSSTAYLMWLHFSEWLIATGIAFGALAAVVLVIEFFASGTIRNGRVGWTHLVLFFAALIVEVFNAFVHTIDGWTAVVPGGMILSILGALLALAAVWALFLVPVTWIDHRRALP